MDAKSHYVHQAHHGRTYQEAHKSRQEAVTKPLREYHNDVKNRLIHRFSREVEDHLDLACGRGGDAWKWVGARIHHVLGVDIAPSLLDDARERIDIIRQKKPDHDLTAEFMESDALGKHDIEWGQTFDTVSCMFAAHYLFESKESANQFFENAAAALKEGGYFYGTTICAKRVLALLGKEKEYRNSVLLIKALWDQPSKFGSGYTFALANTVTNHSDEADDVEGGATEYLTFFSVFTKLAERHGLYPVRDLNWSFGRNKRSRRDTLFEREPADHQEAFRYFQPQFCAHPNSQEQGDAAEADNGLLSDLEKASRLYAAFVFQKDTSRMKRSASDDGQPVAQRAKLNA
ncbi:uncharacterized protein MONBRDRAFT_29289 [Monosiga brevicollis MX1]|uniref:mRNA (guanine-N(7))-methyltransferase n=1 Tax=Monosiga brevicollis TaxID=81824 RepID=A9VAN6_MONBE|nr:uncharacterized protein MONBRDRAFT_29289 [Monosiga brevicollis MX1]EDQ85354.1 predicted protein [Monosiga brevicollis MX1]|eukprot:XP_001749765.1 hypothetical protein [Monosiga brevicollis MX1]